MPRFLSDIPPVTRNLLLVNVLIFLVMTVTGPMGEAKIDRYLALHYFSSPDFNPAQLFTYMFLHGGFTHLFFNMFALYIFGQNIERAFGAKRFLMYYVACGIGAALVQEGVFAIMLSRYTGMFSDQELYLIIDQRPLFEVHADNPVYTSAAVKIWSLVNTPTVGASGAIYGVLLAFGMLWPNVTLMLMIPPMPVKAKWLVIGYAVLELALGLSGRGDGVAHFCHLGGMLVGLVIILYWRHEYRRKQNGF